MRQQLIVFLIFSMTCSLLSQEDNFSKVFNILNHNENAGFIHPISEESYFSMGGGIDQLSPEIITKRYIQYFDSNDQNIYYFDSLTSELADNYIIMNDTFYYLGQYKDAQFPKKLCLFKSSLLAEPLFINKSVYTSNSDIIYPKGLCFDDQFIYTISREKYEENGKTYNVGKFLKLDYSGNVITEKKYDELDNIPDYPDYKNHYNYFVDIDLLPDSFLLMSFLYNPKGYDNCGALYKTDLDGNVIWLKEFDHVYGLNGFPETLVLKDNTYIFNYNKDYRDTLLELEQRPYEKPPVIYRMDSDGNILWEYVFETYPSWHRKSILELIQAGNGDIIGVGSYYGTDISSLELGWIFRMDLEGELLWERYYFEDNFRGWNFIVDVEEMDNGDLVTAGTIEDDIGGITNDKGYGWVMRVDGDGCYYPGCSINDTLQIIKANYYDSIPEFCPKGARWAYGTVDGRYTGGLIYGYEEMNYIKDTLIDQKWCKIISRYYQDKYEEKQLERIIIHQNEYRIYQFFNDSFQLLFDFSKDVGDTLTLDLWNDWYGNFEDIDDNKREGKFLCRIDSVATKYYKNVPFKEYSCTLMCYEDPQNPDPLMLSDGIHFKITEKFFMIDGYWLFNTWSCLKYRDMIHVLRCYEDDEFGFMHFGDVEIACDSILTAAISQPKASKLVLYPNPVFDRLNLELNQSHFWSTWSLHYPDGRLLDEGVIEKSNCHVSISIDKLETGLYLLKLTNSKGIVRVLKFVKNTD